MLARLVLNSGPRDPATSASHVLFFKLNFEFWDYRREPPRPAWGSVLKAGSPKRASGRGRQIGRLERVPCCWVGDGLGEREEATLWLRQGLEFEVDRSELGRLHRARRRSRMGRAGQRAGSRCWGLWPGDWEDAI